MSTGDEVPGGSSATSQQLLLEAKRGNRSALDALIRRALPSLLRYASGRIPRWTRALAETRDVVQDALLRTVRRLSGFESRGEGALRAYLRKAIDNRVNDELRSIRRHGVPADLDDRTAATGADPHQEFLRRDAEERYRLALSRLSETDRRLVVAHVELAYSNEQIAFMTGRRRTDTARVAVGRALARLAHEMARE